MKVKVNVIKERCPKCGYTYEPRKSKVWNQCPKCKHVYGSNYAGDKKERGRLMI